MLEENKNETRIVLIPHNTSHPLSWVVPNVFFKVIVGILTVVFLGIAFFGWEYTQKVVNEQKLARLELQNEHLKETLGEYNRNVSKLRDVMQEYQTFDTDIRIISDLDTLNKDIWNVGVGGIPVVDSEIEQIKQIDPQSAKLIGNIQSNIELLGRRSRLQKDSFDEIISELTSKRDFWNHTPSILPCDGPIISGFGIRRDPITRRARMHEGVDIRAKKGTPIYSSADGTVVFVGRRGGYGLTVEIDHGYGIQTRYAHCSLIKAKKGDRVVRGQTIALVGSTGRSTGAHLHYEVRVNLNKVNPKNYILPDVMMH